MPFSDKLVLSRRSGLLLLRREQRNAFPAYLRDVEEDFYRTCISSPFGEQSSKVTISIYIFST